MFGKFLLGTFGLLFLIYHVHAVDKAFINPTDSQIVKIIQVTDEGEVSLAKLAKSNGQNQELKEFADRVIQQHNQNLKRVNEIAKKNNLSSERNLKSEEIKSEVAQDIKMLKSLKGRNFDLSYINNQVTTHQKILQTLETLLIPATQSKDLFSFLNNTKNKVGEHLDQAVKLQTKLAAEIAK